MLRGRELVEKLIAEKRLDMQSLSYKIGKSRTYMFQYLRRQSPQRLSEDIREALAPLLGVSPDDLREPGDKHTTLARAALSPVAYINKHDAEVMADVIQTLAETFHLTGEVSQIDFAKMCASFYGLAMKKKIEGKAHKDLLPTPSEIEALLQFTNLKR